MTVFRSTGTGRRIGTTAAVLTAILAAPSPAQEPGDTAHITPVIVTATRSPLEVERVPASVTVVTGMELRRQGITHLGDALRIVPGLTVVTSGSFGAPTSLYVRGGQGNYTKVLIDGVAANEPGGAFDFGTLTVDDVERIEVVRGPSSVVWGSDAVSAVVHIITKRGAAPRTTVSARGGSFGTVDVAGSLERTGRTLSGAVTAAHHVSQGTYAQNSDYRNSLLGGSATWATPTGGSLRANARYSSLEAHFPTDFTGAPVDPNAYRVEERASAGAELRQPAGRVTVIAAVSQALIGASSVDPANATPGTSTSFDTRTRRQAAELRGEVPVGARLLVTTGATVERQRRASASTSTSEFSGLPPAVERQEGTAERTTAGGYADALAHFGRATLTAGTRVDDGETFGSFWTYRVGASAEVREGTRIRGSMGTGFREPSFDEVLPSAFSTGNPDLRPERSRSWEVGAEHAFAARRVTVGATWFHQRFADMIDYFADVFPGRYENVASAVARGAELEARVLPAHGWTVDGSVTLVKTRVETAGFGGSLSGGRALLRRPERSATAAISRSGTRGSVTLRAAHVGARTDVRFFHDAPWSAEETLPAYTKVDLSGELPLPLGKAGRHAALTARIDNLFDARYEPAAGYRAPGIAFLVGARAGF